MSALDDIGGSPEQQVEILYRRRQVAKRRIRGQTQEEIAAALEVDRSTVSRDLAAIDELWAKEMAADCARVKAERLASLQEIQREVWAAWAKSQVVAVIEQTKTRQRKRKRADDNADADDEPTTETATTKKYQIGDPRWIQLLLEIESRICKLFGIKFEADEAGKSDEPREQFTPEKQQEFWQAKVDSVVAKLKEIVEANGESDQK